MLSSIRLRLSNRALPGLSVMLDVFYEEILIIAAPFSRSYKPRVG